MRCNYIFTRELLHLHYCRTTIGYILFVHAELWRWCWFPPGALLSPRSQSPSFWCSHDSALLFIFHEKKEGEREGWSDAKAECSAVLYACVFAGKCVRFPGYLNAGLSHVITSNHLHREGAGEREEEREKQTEGEREQKEGEKVVRLRVGESFSSGCNLLFVGQSVNESGHSGAWVLVLLQMLRETECSLLPHRSPPLLSSSSSIWSHEGTGQINATVCTVDDDQMC